MGCQIHMWKDGMSTEQVLRNVLRNYLIRCHRSVSKDYPEVAKMTPETESPALAWTYKFRAMRRMGWAYEFWAIKLLRSVLPTWRFQFQTTEAG